MERSGTHPTTDSLSNEHLSEPKPSVDNGSNLESLLPIADANELLNLIAQGHCPSDLNRLIDQSHSTGSRAA